MSQPVLWFAGLLLGISTLAPPSAIRAQPIEIQFVSVAPPDSLLGQAADLFLLTARSDTTLAELITLVDVSEGLEPDEVLPLTQAGKIGLAVVPTLLLDPGGGEGGEDVGPQPIAVFHQPLAFDGFDGLVAVEESPIGAVALAKLAEADLLGIAYWNNGITHIAATLRSRDPGISTASAWPCSSRNRTTRC